MKRILKVISLLLLPIVLYYAAFVFFEPNNYFGLREKPFGDDIIARLRTYPRNPGNSIIIGDSRMAKFDLELAAQLSGREFTNLASGGASLSETLDLLEWTMQVNPQLEEVVMGLSFYTLNKSYNHNRTVMMAAQNPFVYMTNFVYNLNMLANMKIVLQNMGAPDGQQIETGHANETRDPATYEYVQVEDPCGGPPLTIRKDLVSYSVDSLSQRTTGWQVNEKQLERLIGLVSLCAERNIRLTIVLPPMDDSVWDLIICPEGIEPPMLQALGRLREAGAHILDYEIENRPSFGDDMFFDGFHLDTERGLPVFTEMLFSSL